MKNICTIQNAQYVHYGPCAIKKQLTNQKAHYIKTDYEKKIKKNLYEKVLILSKILNKRN